MRDPQPGLDQPLGWSLRVMVAFRMAIVTMFVIAMPCWAVFWAHQQAVGGARQAVAKAALPAEILAPAVGHDRVPVAQVAKSPDERLRSRTTSEARLANGFPSQQGDRIRHLETRLQHLGAAYLRLTYQPGIESGEPRHESSGTYHFVCRIPVPGTSLYHRLFETTAADPVSAMQHVVSEVERWREKRTAE